MPSGLRRSPRFPYDGKVRLVWDNTRQETLASVARVVDVSVDGMQLASPHPLPVRQIIQFQLQGTYFEGSASVRNCFRTGVLFRIGVEFGGGLKFKVPVDASGAAPPQNQ